MPFVKWFVVATGGLIVVALLALFLIGRRPDAGRVTGVIELDAPPEAVTPWLVEPGRLRKWVGFLREVQGDTSGVEVGRRQVWQMDDGQGGRIPMSSELVMYAPPDSLRLHVGVPGLLDGEQTYVLTDLGGRTRLAIACRYRHPNAVVALLEPMATPQAAQKLRADLARLATFVAGEARGAAVAADSTTAR